jgi:hypothetical protein
MATSGGVVSGKAKGKRGRGLAYTMSGHVPRRIASPDSIAIDCIGTKPDIRTGSGAHRGDVRAIAEQVIANDFDIVGGCIPSKINL